MKHCSQKKLLTSSISLCSVVKDYTQNFTYYESNIYFEGTEPKRDYVESVVTQSGREVFKFSCVARREIVFFRRQDENFCPHTFPNLVIRRMFTKSVQKSLQVYAIIGISPAEHLRRILSPSNSPLQDQGGRRLCT